MPSQSADHHGGAMEHHADARPDPAIIFDGTTFQIQFANKSALGALGRSELGTLKLTDFTPSLSAEALSDLIRRADAEALGVETRIEFDGPEGEIFPTAARIEKLSGGMTAHYQLHFGSKIGAEPEGTLALESALLRSVIETAPDAIITIGTEGRIASFSPAAERMFGYAASEVIGQNVNVLMPEPYHSEHDGYIERYISTGEKRIIGIGRTVIARHKSGKAFPMELAVGEVRSGGHRVFTGFIRDISERVAAQARAAELQRDLHHVGRLSAMGEIASMIVHELNQPLTAIANFGEAARRLLEKGGDRQPRAGEFMGKSVAQAHRASEMIKRLRGFVSNKVSQTEIIAVNDVVRDAARLALIGAADYGIDTKYLLSDDLPALPADRIQVQQVIVNLIRNAIDAMVERGDTHGHAMHLTIESRFEQDDAVCITVSDTGPGIAPEIATDLFKPFSSTKPGGMGIGLSICRSIVESHGGRIWTEPGMDGGSRFSFTLPVSRKTDEAQ